MAALEDNEPAEGEPTVRTLGGEAAVSGAPEEGHTLMADVTGITDDNDIGDEDGDGEPDFEYQWQRETAPAPGDWEDVAGATGETYELADGDVGRRIRVRVSFRDQAGHVEGPLTSAPTLPVQAAPTAGNAFRIEAWMGLFGRAVSDQVLDAVGRRLHAAPSCAQQGEMSLAGRQVRWTPGDEDDAFAANAVRAWFGGEDPRDWLGVRALKDEEALRRSSFSLTHGAPQSGCVSLWGRGGHTSFAGREGEVELEGELTMGQFGADWSFGPWVAGLSVGHSDGEGDYRDEEGGSIESTLTGVYPYARYALTERSSAWAVTGYGEGDLKVVPKGGSGSGNGNGAAVETDVALTMGAAGMRTELTTADEAGGGVSLALKADASIVRMDSEATEALAALQSHANRLRLGLEAAGSRTALAHGGTLAPVVDLGVLYDGGDAGSGRGMDAGVGLAYAHPARGLSADFQGRSLFAHSGPGRREWGISGGLRYDADPLGSRGLSVSLDGGYGGRSTTGGLDALFDRQTVEDLHEGGDAALPGARMGAELGYGLRAFEGRYTGTPKASLGLTETGSTWGLGWWFTPSAHGAPDLSGGLELEGGEEDGRRIGLRLDAKF